MQLVITGKGYQVFKCSLVGAGSKIRAMLDKSTNGSFQSAKENTNVKAKSIKNNIEKIKSTQSNFDFSFGG